MAAKVNTKFVVGLLAVMLIAVAGVGFLAMRAFAASGDRQFAQGEEALVRYERALAAGNEAEAREAIRQASSAFERAVGREPTRVDWLEKWHEALLRVTPNSPTDAERQYRWYQQIPRSIAMLRPEEPERAMAYFERLWTPMQGGTTIPNYEYLITEVDALTRRLPEDNPLTHRVRAYKAKGIVRLMGMTAVDEQRREEALRLLERARDAMPNDADVRIWLSRWHLAQERHLRDIRRPDAAVQALNDAERIVADGLEAMPDSLALQLQGFEIARVRLFREGRADSAREVLTPLVGRIVQTLRASPIDSLDLPHALGVAQQAIILGTAEEASAAMDVVRAYAEANQNDPRAWLELANLHELRREHEQQMEAAGRVLAMPDPTVGLNSRNMPRFRRVAAQFQLDAALAQWETARSAEERARHERVASEKLERFAALVPSTDAYLLSDRRGRIALLRGNPAEALGPLAEAVRGYEAAGGRPPLSTLRNLGMALEQTNNPGEARRTWQRVLNRATETGGDDFMARLRIGNLSADLREYESALETLQALSDRLGPGNNALALFAIGRLYETLLDRGETITLPGRGRLTEQQLLAEGMRVFQQLREIAPEDGQVLAALSRMAARSGEGGDPALTALFNAQRQFDAGNFDAAERILADAIARGHGSPRAWLIRADALNSTGKPEQAREVLEEAEAAYPDDPNIQRALQIARSDNPMEAVLATIDDPFQQALVRLQIASSQNDEAGVEAALREARRLNPDHVGLLEFEFERAIQRREWDRAGAFARQAGDRNADQVGGLLFQGRLHHARGNYADAVRTLRQAVQQLEFNPVAWRWLGLSQMRLGQTNDAVESLARAVQGRPSDQGIARDYANALVRAGRGAEALAAIDDRTGVLRFGQRNPEMIEFWLDLAVRFGGAEGRETALRERRAMYERDPSNALNAAQLATTLFDAQEWNEAAAIIDRLSNNANANATDVAALRARWLQRQGRVQEAIGAFESHLASEPSLRDTANGHLAFGELLLEFGLPDRALARFERADELSEPGQTRAARWIADIYFQAGSEGMQNADLLAGQGQGEQADLVRKQASEYYSRALERYARVLASLDPQTSPESHTATGLRIVEGQIRLERFSDAEQTLGSLSALAQNDVRRSIFRASIASARGDVRRARQIMNDAVRDHPNDATAFLNRARINAGDEAMIVDVLADLDRAAELQPGNMEVWELRVSLLRARGEMNSALASLRSAIRVNPNQDSLRGYLIDTLLRAGRTAEAADEAVRFADDRPRNIEAQTRTIVMLQQVGRWNDASRLLARLRELEPNNPFYAAAWLDAQLNAGVRLTPAQANPVLRVIRSASAYGTPSESITWANTEARVTHSLQQAAQASRDESLARRYRDESLAALRRGLLLIGDNASSASAWFNTAGRVLGGGLEAMQFARANLGDQPPHPMLLTMEQGFRLMAAGDDASAIRTVLVDIESLLSAHGDDPLIRMELLKTRGFASMQAQDHAKAAESFGLVVQSNPNDPISLNNLAYVLATELGQPARALEYAQRAQAIAPENPTVLDTLGTIYLSFDPPRFDEAESMLRRALTFARTPDELLPVNVHLAQALIGQDRRAQARTAVEAARRALPDADASLRRIYMPQLEALESKLR